MLDFKRSRNLRNAGVAVAAVVGLVVIFVIANTIRLTIVARRELHRVMFLLGASGRFVRLPHLLEGVLVSVIYALFRLIEPHLTVLPIFLPWRWMASFILAAGSFGLVGSAIALSRMPPEDRAR